MATLKVIGGLLGVVLTIVLLGSLGGYIWLTCDAGWKKEDVLVLLNILISQPVLGTGAVVGLAAAFKDPITNLLNGIGRR